MTEVRAVRAWAEYEDARVFMNPMHDTPGKFTRWEIPTGANGDPLYSTHFDGVEEFVRRSSQKYGPLRSLRVLLGTGHEVDVHRVCSLIHDGEDWNWRLDDRWPVQGFDDCPDAEAVERALAEAIAWIQGQQEVTK